jgi:hypothetical protein
MPPGVQVLGPYSGKLSNGGDKVQISMPGDINLLGERQYIRIDRVNYSDGTGHEDVPGGVDLWPTTADGAGASLSRKVAEHYGNDPNNWDPAYPPTPGE